MENEAGIAPENPVADLEATLARVRALRTGKIEAAREPEGLTIETPDAALNAFANGFLLHQVRASRVLGRAGLCQPGGAWGFRDQLQDMLALLHSEPGRVRAHLLRCAGRQFEAGDVLHWWHAPCSGVRTRVSDDRLFLPWVTAAYVKYTGDGGVLEERASYLEDVPLPDGAEDVYREMRPGKALASLHEHCMAAFRASARFGPHGLLLMGTGDWNDGMNRLGAKGRGESVWLSQFAVACADRYRAVAPEGEQAILRYLSSGAVKGIGQALAARRLGRRLVSAGVCRRRREAGRRGLRRVPHRRHLPGLGGAGRAGQGALPHGAGGGPGAAHR